jgi:competence protein ComEC
LPLLLYENGLFSVIALPANALVLPVVPLAMLSSFVAMLAGLIFPIAAPLFGLPAYALLSYIIGVVEFASSLPLAAFTIPTFPFSLVVISYVLLGLFAVSRAGVYPSER